MFTAFIYNNVDKSIIKNSVSTIIGGAVVFIIGTICMVMTVMDHVFNNTPMLGLSLAVPLMAMGLLLVISEYKDTKDYLRSHETKVRYDIEIVIEDLED